MSRTLETVLSKSTSCFNASIRTRINCQTKYHWNSSKVLEILEENRDQERAPTSWSVYDPPHRLCAYSFWFSFQENTTEMYFKNKFLGKEIICLLADLVQKFEPVFNPSSKLIRGWEEGGNSEFRIRGSRFYSQSETRLLPQCQLNFFFIRSRNVY